MSINFHIGWKLVHGTEPTCKTNKTFMMWMTCYFINVEFVECVGCRQGLL